MNEDRDKGSRSQPPVNGGSWAFRVLLRLYPAEYRRGYAREMEIFFQEDRRRSGGGPWFWIRLTLDHMEAAWAVRRRKRRRGMGMMSSLREDLTSAWRTLRRSPAFTAFAVLTLALGIGATTSVFSVLDCILLRPLPYPGSERMVRIGIEARVDPGEMGPLSPALASRYQEAPGPAEAMVAASTAGMVLTDTGHPERVVANRVTRGFFEFFGARPSVGRLVQAADYEPGAPKTVVLGHELWTTRYGADEGVVGTALRLDDELYTVVGVLAEDFAVPTEVAGSRDLWVPLALAGEELERSSFYMAGIVRLRSGASIQDMKAYADQVVAELYPPVDGRSFVVGGAVRGYRDTVVGPIGNTLPRVMAAVALLLLIACVNVAGLLLTRGAQRAHEMTVRAALGAGRARMVRQLLAESILLAAAGALIGSALAWISVKLFRSYAPAGLPRLEEVAVDARSLVFSLVLAGATVVLFGLVPALRSSDNARAGARTVRSVTTTRRDGRIRATLISLETALAVVLAVGSSLLARDLVRLAQEEPGFRPDGIAVMRLDLRSRYEQEEWAGVWRRILDGTRALPGVTTAALATQAPYGGTSIAATYRPEGLADDQEEFLIQVMVAGDYVDALGTHLVEGRALGPGDDGTNNVALVNEAFVRRFWPGESALGKLIYAGPNEVDEEPPLEVVGVLADVRTHVGREVPPHVFVPMAGSPWSRMEVLARTDGKAGALAGPLRELVSRIDPSLPVWRITTVEGIAQEGFVRPRFYTGLFGGFALVALLLALVGVYGTTSYATRTRVREIGIRMALGARRTRVVGGVVGRTAAVIGVGVATGLVAAGAGARVMTDVLVHVAPRDVVAYAIVALVVMVAGVLAAWIPAGRAGRVDPASTLREEA